MERDYSAAAAFESPSIIKTEAKERHGKMTDELALFDVEITPITYTASRDPELEEIAFWFSTHRNLADRFAQVFRRSIDEVLDGQRTGRYDLYLAEGVGRVEKTEKTYLGTKVEIVARAEFDLGYGHPMDYLINGVNVDAKFTMGSNWAIPKEALGHICMLMTANDNTGTFHVGLLRTTADMLNAGMNGDGKRGVSVEGKRNIRWLVQNGELPKNFLLELKREEPGSLAKIWHTSSTQKISGAGGQARVNELFRLLPGRLIDRTTVVTVAMQHDGPKRVRDARKHLRPEGFIILGHLKPAPQIAEDLGLPVPSKGSWVSARLALVPEQSGRRTTLIDGARYSLWQEGDTSIAAPLIDT
ncbi:NaeI family type II restriction endonuclease [Streptomyces sp. NBC_01594]|uniref:NaeI family type II restriction endonuclease n=1 Tax=Streptomyces sp. NBC_01594 TaxID=2975890 RepID=UPI0038699A79